MQRSSILILAISALSLTANGQVKHNYEVEPSNTDCHQLPSSFETAKAGLEKLENTTFRVTQNLKISRYQSPRALAYYSCDGKNGFLTAEIDEEKKIIFYHVPLETWNELNNTNDPISFYATKIEGYYESID